LARQVFSSNLSLSISLLHHIEKVLRRLGIESPDSFSEEMKSSVCAVRRSSDVKLAIFDKTF
jgi:hypothetical protein